NFTHGTLEEGKLDAVAYYVDYDYKRERYRVHNDLSPKDIKTSHMDTRYAGFDTYYTKRFNDHTFLLGTSFLGHEATDVTEIKWETDEDPWELDDYGEQLADADKTYYDYAIYAQDQWKVTDKLELTFGARYDQPDEFDAEWSYRLGSVYSFNKETFAKALFGTAFRIPTYREFRVQDLDGTPKYDDDLSSERMKTYELSIGQNKKSGNSWLLTGFYNKYIDYINDEYVAAVDDEVFYNNKGRTVKGIELSGSYWIEPKLLNLRGSLTCMDHYDDTTHEDLHGVSNWLAFAELTYHATDKLSFAVNGQYASKPHVDANYQSGIPAAQVDSGLNDDYFILGAVATYKYNKNVEFQLIGQNITDTKYYSPHFGPSSNYDYEWPGAEFMFRARIIF
ncbi:MAG: TonB-dependent receptor, partial [Planctomycetes bacterium]|nr:TonB-dependent receptor [Planctomycetota bacterium]